MVVTLKNGKQVDLFSYVALLELTSEEYRELIEIAKKRNEQRDQANHG